MLLLSPESHHTFLACPSASPPRNLCIQRSAPPPSRLLGDLSAFGTTCDSLLACLALSRDSRYSLRVPPPPPRCNQPQRKTVDAPILTATRSSLRHTSQQILTNVRRASCPNPPRRRCRHNALPSAPSKEPYACDGPDTRGKRLHRRVYHPPFCTAPPQSAAAYVAAYVDIKEMQWLILPAKGCSLSARRPI